LSADQRTERAAVLAATTAAALLIAQQVAARTTRDALFLSAFRIESLPFVMMASAVLALVGAQAMSRTLARRAPYRVMPIATAVSAVLLVIEWALVLTVPRAGAVVVYLHVATFGGALVSGFWSLVNERFDPYTARRVMGRIGTGATAGGVAGGALAWLASRSLEVPTSLLLLAVLGALATLALANAGRSSPARAREEKSERPAPALPLLARTAYLRDLALVVALGSVVDAVFDFLFKAKAVERFSGGAELMSVFAVFHVVLSIVSFVFQGLFARSVLQHLGLAGTVALRPLVDVAAAVLGAVAPRFATAVLARGGHESLTNSLFRSGYELFYTPLPEGEKRRVKALIDVAVDKAGTLIGSATVGLALFAIPALADRALFVLAAVVSLVVLGLSRRLHRGYVTTLENSLLAGRVHLGSEDTLDRTTQLTLAHSGLIERSALLSQIEALRNSAAAVPAPPRSGTQVEDEAEPSAESGILDELGRIQSGSPSLIRGVLRRNPEPEPVLVAALVPLLFRDELYPDIVRTLRRVAPRVTGQLVDSLLDRDADAVVRRRIPRILKAAATSRSAEGLTVALDDEVFAVRASAAAALASLHEKTGIVRMPKAVVFDRVLRELRVLPGGDGAERHLAHVFSLLSLVLEPQPLRIAWAALRGTDATLRGTALEYLSTVLPDDVFVPLRQRVAPGKPTPSSGPKRTAEQMVQELRLSSTGLRLEGAPWRKAGEGG